MAQEIILANKVQDLIVAINRLSKKPRKPEYEYKILPRPLVKPWTELEEEINILSQDGWRVIKIEEYLIFLEREKKIEGN